MDAEQLAKIKTFWKDDFTKEDYTQGEQLAVFAMKDVGELIAAVEQLQAERDPLFAALDLVDIKMIEAERDDLRKQLAECKSESCLDKRRIDDLRKGLTEAQAEVEQLRTSLGDEYSGTIE